MSTQHYQKNYELIHTRSGTSVISKSRPPSLFTCAFHYFHAPSRNHVPDEGRTSSLRVESILPARSGVVHKVMVHMRPQEKVDVYNPCCPVYISSVSLIRTLTHLNRCLCLARVGVLLSILGGNILTRLHGLRCIRSRRWRRCHHVRRRTSCIWSGLNPRVTNVSLLSHLNSIRVGYLCDWRRRTRGLLHVRWPGTDSIWIRLAPM